MFKQALHAYWKALNPKNLKKEQIPSFMWLIYMLIGYPAIIDFGNEGISTFLLTIPLTPFVWLIYSENMMHAFISKVIYICPMKRAERRAYVRTLLHIRIGMPILLAMVFELLWASLVHSGMLEVISSVFLYCSMAISFSVKSKLKSENGKIIDFAFREQDGNVKKSYINIANILLSALTMVFVVVVERFHDIGFLVGFIIGGSIVLIFIFDILIWGRQYNDCIDNACDYELYLGMR